MVSPDWPPRPFPTREQRRPLGVRLQRHGAGIAFALSIALLELPAGAAAQMPGMSMSLGDSARASGAIRVQGIALVTRVDPGFANRPFTEGYLAQPVIMAH